MGNKHKSNIFLLSSETKESLMEKNDKYKKLISDGTIDLERESYKLQMEETRHKFRNFIIADDENGVSIVSNIYEDNNSEKDNKKEIIFMVAGTGSDYENMAIDLYNKNKVFKKYYDKCNELIKSELGDNVDIIKNSDSKLNVIKIFSVSYSVAETLTEMGIKPDKLMGMSLGEYAVAAISGIMKFEEAIKLVVRRTNLIFTLPDGNMVSVEGKLDKIKEVLFDGISIASILTPNLCVLSLESKYLNRLESVLKENNIKYKLVPLNKAGHSDVMRLIEKDFRKELDKIDFSESRYDIVSTFEGKIVDRNHMSNSDYWINQMAGSVLFPNSIADVTNDDSDRRIFIEVGPGKQLSTFTKMNLRDRDARKYVFSVLENINEYECFLNVLGELWKIGFEIDWSLLH